MADKVQNVFINFKYNTPEIEKATQITNRANEATNRLQQSAQKAGRASEQSYRAATQSIGAMQTALSRLKTQIEVSSNPARVKQLADQYKQLKTQLDQATKAAFDNSKAMKELSASSNSSAQGISGLFNALKLVISAGITREIVNIGLEMARLSGRVEGVERAFNRAFPNSVQTLNELREATHGAVTDFELMQRTLQATNLGVDVKSLPQLFEFAAARAQQTGESVDYLVDSIVRGIGRKSLLILDNLGISATRLKDQFNGASLASLSVGEVTKGVAEIVRVEMDKMGGYVETSETKVKQLEAQWESLRTTLSKKFQTGGVVDFFKDAISGLEAALKGGKQLTNERVAAESARQADFVIQSQEFKILEKSQSKQIDFLIQEIAERQRLVRLRQTEIDQAEKRRQQILDGLGFFEDPEMATRGLNEMIKAQKANRDVISGTIPILSNYIAELRKVQDVESDVVSLGIIERKRAEIEKIQEAIEKTNKSANLSSRLGVGKLVTDLAVAQAQLNELLNGPENRSFNLEAKPDKTKAVKDFEALVKDLTASLPEVEIKASPAIIQKDFADQLQEAFKASQGDIINAGTDIFADQLVSIEEAEVVSLQNRLNNLREYYDQQQLLAGDNERAKQLLRLKEERETAALQRKIAQKEKEARRFSVIIDTAAGIVRAFATSPTIAQGIINAALVAAQGASQLAIINRTSPKFKDGVINLQGPGTATSDSIHARLSKGESVMTAKETRSSMGILKDIRAKKLDDQVLQGLKLGPEGVRNVGMDDSRLIKKLDELKNSQPDLISQSGKLYQQFSYGDTYKKKIRVKTMGY